jgi:GNAT superfamily N-acetyltransferase
MSSAVGQVPADETPATTASLLAPFERDVLLATGRAIHVRPAGPLDVERLRSFYDQLTDTSNRLRFFGLRRFIPDDELRRATVQDVHQQVTLVAESDGPIIGVGEYHARPARVEAEVAFAVADAHHHEGVATVLLEDLALVARAAGFRRLVADTLPGNMAMLGVFSTVGLVHRHWFEDGTVRVQLDLTADDLLQDHADLRDWRAAVRSLRSIAAPSLRSPAPTSLSSPSRHRTSAPCSRVLVDRSPRMLWWSASPKASKLGPRSGGPRSSPRPLATTSPP